MPSLALGDARLLLPRRSSPDEIAVVGARAAVPGPATLAVSGRLPRGLRNRLLAAGYRLASYAVGATASGTWARPATGWRATFHVADRTDPTPAAVAVSGAGPLELATFDGDARRRAAFRCGATIVKVERAQTETSRGAAEQEVLAMLRRVGLGHLAPEPLGAGVTGGLAWSAESFAPGTPLHQVRDIDVYDRVAGALTEVATATRADRARPPSEDDVLPLRGRARSLVEELPRLEAVPAVLAHGDVATGFNVLVDGERTTIIDWETARSAGLPLVDLLPLLCLGSARVAGCRTVEGEADHVLALCRGRGDRSPWLFGHVGRHLAVIGVPLEHAGTLAALAWSSFASMRLVYRELVPDAPDWTTAADIIAARWADDPALGSRWSAFAEHGGA